MAKKCLHCGASMPEEANICLHCLTICNNTSANFDKQTLKHKKKKPTKKRLSILIAAIIFVQAVLSLGAVQMDQPVTPATISKVGTSNADTDTNESNPVSKFFKKVFGIKDDTQESNTSSNISSGKAATSVSNTANANTNASSMNTSGNTESHGAAPNQPSSGNQENNTTIAPTAPTSSQPEEKPVLNYGDYEYKTDTDGEIQITKYTGSDSCILIPDQINGIDVGSIESYAFKDNSTLQTVYFKDSENYHILWVNPYAFYNCKNLKKVVFPKNTDLGIQAHFALQCTSMKEIEVEHWQYRFIDGGLYYYSGGWSLSYYCEGYTASTYRIPDWCGGIAGYDCFTYNQYVKKFYLNDTSACLLYNHDYPYIEEYIADSDYYISIDGVLFKKESNATLSLYILPKAKKDTSFTFPENCQISLTPRNCNDYIETLRIPKTATFSTDTQAEHIKTFFGNLKTIYIEKGHPQKEIIKYHSNFLGKVIEY